MHRKAPSLAFAAFLLLVLLSSPARAEAPPALDHADVTLRGSRTVTGRVQELVPGDHLTLEVAGELRRIDWSDVERISPVPPPPEPAPALAPAPAPAPAPALAPAPAPSSPSVRVHLTGKKTIRLYRRDAPGTPWTLACETPCDLDLPLAAEYAAMTGADEPSDGASGFRFESPPGGRVEVKSGHLSTAAIALGAIVLSVGTITAYVGALSSDSSQGAELGIGLGLMAGGIVAIVAGASSDISQRAVPREESRAAVRAPTWRMPPPAPAGETTFPLLRLAF